MQTSSKRQIKRETRPDWLATRSPFFFVIREAPPPRGSGQIAYKRPTLLELDLTVINTEFFSHIPSRDTSTVILSPCPGKVNFLVLEILGRAFLRTLGAPKLV